MYSADMTVYNQVTRLRYIILKEGVIQPFAHADGAMVRTHATFSLSGVWLQRHLLAVIYPHAKLSHPISPISPAEFNLATYYPSVYFWYGLRGRIESDRKGKYLIADEIAFIRGVHYLYMVTHRPITFVCNSNILSNILQRQSGVSKMFLKFSINVVTDRYWSL